MLALIEFESFKKTLAHPRLSEFAISMECNFIDARVADIKSRPLLSCNIFQRDEMLILRYVLRCYFVL